MPTFTLIAAQSLDGLIARHGESGAGFCSAADQAFLSEALQSFDCMVMGRKTYDTLRARIDRSPATRWLRKVQTRSPDAYRERERPELLEFTDAEPRHIAAEFAERGRQRCALLGGAESYGAFLAADLVDALWLTIEPVMFGGGTPLARAEVDQRYELEDVTKLAASTLLLKYRRQR